MNDTNDFRKRNAYRHPASIPIEISMSDLVANKKEYLVNISRCGLCFRSSSEVTAGTPISIKVPLTRPVFATKAHVAWCKRNGDIYEVGVSFDNQGDPLKIRMVEQICDIEEYKMYLSEKECRMVTSEEAAMEWIRKYAASFSEDR